MSPGRWAPALLAGALLLAYGGLGSHRSTSASGSAAGAATNTANDSDAAAFPVVEFPAMGTVLRIELAGVDAARRPAAQRALVAVQQRIVQFDRDAAPWHDGALAQFNQALYGGADAAIPSALQALFAQAWALQTVSGGRFEPRIGALVRLWGFDESARLPQRPPAAADIDAALAALRAAPAYAGGERYGPAPGVNWDFGAIAKGYIVAESLQQLQQAGFTDALVDAGGNLAAHGRHGTRRWNVAIRNPAARDDGARQAPPFLATLEIDDESVNTHGDYERYFAADGQRYGHLLDPHSGRPARGLRALSVVDADPVRADALGAALFVAGPAQWPALARDWGLQQVLAVDADGRIRVTAALAARLHWATGVHGEVVPP